MNDKILNPKLIPFDEKEEAKRKAELEKAAPPTSHSFLHPKPKVAINLDPWLEIAKDLKKELEEYLKSESSIIELERQILQLNYHVEINNLKLDQIEKQNRTIIRLLQIR